MASSVTSCNLIQSCSQNLLTSLESNQTISIRAQGRNCKGKCVYNVLGTDYNILGTLHVNEEDEAIEFRDETDQVLYFAEGGLFCPSENMALWGFDRSGTKFKIARIYNAWIVYFADGSTFQSSELNMVHSSDFMMKDKIISVKNSCGEVVVELSQRSCSIFISLMLPTCSWSGSMRSIMVLYALKMYHTTYQLHQNPMPQNILSELPVERCDPSTPFSCVFDNIQRFRIRAAYKDLRGELLFTDVLDGQSGQIKMVAEETVQCEESSLYIKDEFGLPQISCFFGTRDIAPTVRVYDKCESLVGFIRRENADSFVILDAVYNKICLVIQRKTCPFLYYQVASTISSPQKPIARIYEDRYTVVLDFDTRMEPQQKALLLIFAHIQAFKLLENKHPYPPVAFRYPYRPSSA